MATVLLLRHGRTEANADGVLAGWSPVGLDETGLRQAKEAGERLRGAPLKAVWSSPLPRCRQTLQIALEGRPDLSVTVDERLGECRYGDWQGRRLDQLVDEPMWRVVQEHPSAAMFPGDDGEPLAAMAARSVAVIREADAQVAAEHGADAMWLACSHGDVIKAIAADALGMHVDLFQRIVVEPASVTAIRYTATRPFLLRLNDTGGELSALSAPASGRKSSTQAADGSDDSDAAVGGGAGV